ncbi:MAG TPA: fibronectin type III domain-containing protein [Dermatophilaceae bacterium]|nr:fibronectin type III domain-containing protein [Dermatophilaceae bacterium]
MTRADQRTRSRRRVGIASSLVLVILAGVLTWFATRAEGETVRRAELNDGGVWVTNSAQGRFGRVNKPAGQLDAAVASSTPENTGLDIVQDGAVVLGITKATNQAIPVNVRSATLSESAAITLATPAGGASPLQPTIDLRGGTVAIVEPATGKVRAQRVDPQLGVSGLDQLQPGSQPLTQVGAGAVLAVGVDGTVYAVSAGGSLAVLRPTAATTARPGPGATSGSAFEAAALAELGLSATGQPSLQLSVVGTRWVLLDSQSGLLRVDGLPAPIDLKARLGGLAGDPAAWRLQQPGPDADAVVVGTAQAAVVIPISGDTASTGDIGLPSAAGTGQRWVAAPVRIGGCVHGAWADATAVYYGRSCTNAPAEAVTLTGRMQANPSLAARGQSPTAADGVALRVNRGMVVLNDLDTGALWDVDSPKPIKIDDWNSVIPPPRAGDTNVKPNPDDVADQQVRRPPEANPDVLNVRPGRTSTLHVLDNDTDSTGAVLAIAPGDVTQPDVPGVLVSPSVDGQTISVSVPEKPVSSVIHFTYAVNNGNAGPEGRASTSVTLTVVGAETNSAPHLRPGQAKLAQTRTPVIAGQTVAVSVLADWRDDESDPVVVEPLESGTSVDGSGSLTVTAPKEPGNRELRYRVDDGRGGHTEAKVGVVVLGPTDRPVAPIAQADVVRAVQGKPVQLQPLGNDIPGADPTDPSARMRLAAEVRGPVQLLVDTNLDTGVVTVTGSVPGSYLLTYAAQVGSSVGAGRFRVDILAPPPGEAPPVAAPDAATVREQAPTITDVLANDYSPRSDVLVITSVATADPWVRAWVVQGRWLRVQSTTPLPVATTERRGVVAYTISDGTRTATGELSVVQKPAPAAAVLPTVVDDQATVRWGDVVTMPVLDNDSMADGVPLKIQPPTVKVLSGGGQVYPTGSVLRYLPPATPITDETVATLEYAAYPEGMPERAVTARVTVAIKPLPSAQRPNQAPTARTFSASVTAGEAVTLTVPTSGIDPDGDLGYVSGIVGEDKGPVNLRLGRVVSFGASSLRYEAYPMSSGTEVIRYAVTDRFGASSEGLIRVGIVQPGAPQPPVAVADEVVAAPGRTVSVDVLANDLVPRNADVTIEDPAKINDPTVLAQFTKEQDNTFRVTAPDEGPAKVLVYGIEGGLFDPSRATLTVRGRRGFNNPPVAVDDVARTTAQTIPPGAQGPQAGPAPSIGPDGQPVPVQAPTSVLVDVLANDRDLDAERSALKVVEVGEGATITPEGVRVSFADHPRAVPYVIEDADGGRALALIYVPANGSDTPYAVSGKVITVPQDASTTILLGDHVADPRLRPVRITTPDALSSSPSANLTVRADSATELTLTASGGYVGPAALMLEVTDRLGPDDQSPRTAYLVLPVQVGPLTPLLRCPSWEVNVTAGADPRVIDVPRLCSAWYPEGLDPDTVSYVATWEQQVDHVTLAQGGTGGRKVTVTADPDGVHGANGSFLVGVEGQTQRYPMRVRVTSLKTAPPGTVAPGADVPPPPPLAVLRPARVEGLVAGQSQVVNLAQYLDSPFGTLHCNIEGVRVSSGGGVSASSRGCVLTVSAAADARGSTVLTVDVSDGPDRVTTGTVTVSVLSRPGAPGGVTAIADRELGGSARVSWVPPAYDGGLPIEDYLVSWGGGSLVCHASPCTVTGLVNGQGYVFTVRARNAAGLGDPSAGSDTVTPDTAPGPVSIFAATPGDGVVSLNWATPTNQGSAIQGYEVRVVAGDGSASWTVPLSPVTATTITGLDNRVAYSFSVHARNDLGYGAFGPTRIAQSAGAPITSGAPTLEYPKATPQDDGVQVTIRWDPADANGPDLVSYTVWTQVNGGGWQQFATLPPRTLAASDTVPYDGRTVQYAVTATNGAGLSSKIGAAATFQAVGVPEAPRPASVTTPDPDKRMTVSFGLGSSRGRGWDHVNYETTAGVSGSIPCTTASDCALTVAVANGQIAQQTLRIQACAAGGVCSDWSGPSNSFQPYGPTLPVTALAPSAVKKGGGSFDVTFAWEVTTNGRPVSITVTATAGASTVTCRENQAQTACLVSGVPYSTKVTVVVTATSDAGAAPGVSMSLTTPDKVPPTITLSAGSTCVGPACGAAYITECSGTNSCAFIRVTSTAWDASTMSCTFTINGTEIGVDGTVATNTTNQQTSVPYGKAGTITGRCTSALGEVATDTIAWKDYPPPVTTTPTTTIP